MKISASAETLDFKSGNVKIFLKNMLTGPQFHRKISSCSEYIESCCSDGGMLIHSPSSTCEKLKAAS